MILLAVMTLNEFIGCIIAVAVLSVIGYVSGSGAGSSSSGGSFS